MENEKAKRKRYYNTETASRAQAKYDAKNTRHVSLKFNRATDADIIAKLAAVAATEGIQAYIKKVIRNDLKKGG